MRLRTIASAPVLGAVLLALMLSVAWTANLPIEDPYSTRNTGWNGTSGLAARGFLPVNELLTEMLASVDATGVLLVVGPSRQFTGVEADSIGDFVRKGGLLVVADSFGSGNGLLDLLGLSVRFDGRTLVDPLFYEKQSLFPIITDFGPSGFLTSVDKLVLDYATVLSIRAEDRVTILANSSPFSFLDSKRDGEKNPNEPSGPFPVLAELQLGEGTVIVFTSPASFANGLIDEAKNGLLAENIANHGSGAERRPLLLLDQTHLQPSPSTPAKLMARQLFASILGGGMQLSEKLALMGIGVVLVAVRYMYKRPQGEALVRAERSHAVRPMDVESLLQLHPTWDRKMLEYVTSEVEASMSWRGLSEQE